MSRASRTDAHASDAKPSRNAATGELRAGRRRDLAALFLLSVAVLAVYCPPSVLTDGARLFGGDVQTLHQRRIEFARDALFGGRPHLPAWYPREFMGTPFWSNVQNFPLIPTRLLLLPLLDPWSVHTFAVQIAAVLAAAFTFAFVRQLGVGRFGAGVAGWTFACAGFFAARVYAGHLPLLEAYPALPLLLWLAERCVRAERPTSLRRSLIGLGAATCCVMLAGHPQLSLYAVGCALGYLALRGWTLKRRAALAAAAVVAGIACASVALVPMAQLVGRSTRVLDLDRAANDVAFPAWRLKAFAVPWADGWPGGVRGSAPARPFVLGKTEEWYFYDTVCYVGWLPLIAAAGLAAHAVRSRRWPARPWVIVGGLGTLALLFAIPQVRDALPLGGSWTLLRSPARQVYVTGFAAALAAGVAVDRLARLANASPARSRRLAVGALLAVVAAAHAVDLGRHARAFVVARPIPEEGPVPSGDASTDQERVAIDTMMLHPLNRRVDDVGVFDSVLLARPYRTMLALGGQPARLNQQFFDGVDFGPRGLAWGGVRLVLTARDRMDGLEARGRGEHIFAYEVPAPLPRAGVVPAGGVQYLDDAAVYDAMRAGAAPDPAAVFLPPDARAAVEASSPAATSTVNLSPATIAYRRPSSDEIEVDVSGGAPGVLRILEAWDPGWRATVDGKPAAPLVADGFVIALPLPAGEHRVRLVYATPGVWLGALMSLAGLTALSVVVMIAPRVAGTSLRRA